MKTINFKNIFLLSIIVLGISSCKTNDDNKNSGFDNEEGILSNSEIRLTYGSDLLSQYINNTNTTIAFNNYSENINTRAVAFDLLKTKNYNDPDLTNAIKLTGSNDVNINQSGKVYYIANGDNYSGNLNFNQASTVYVLGTWDNGRVNVPAGGIVEVAPSGKINNPQFTLNSSSILNNYGVVNFSKGSVDGKINNYNSLTFINSVNINGSASELNNYCTLIFNNEATINTKINNYSYINFNDLTINGAGSLVMDSGSLVDINGSNLRLNGKIINNTSEYARLDINNVNNATLNATPAFQGKIDINSKLTIPKNKISSDVLLNANIFIDGNQCLPQRGNPICDDSSLKFTLVSSIKSPVVNSTTLSATDVKVNQGRAYVSYHTNDEYYGDTPNGSIRIFDVQNQQSPSLVAQADFNSIEFNGIDVNNENLYAVGGNKAGAKMITTTLSSGLFNTTNLSNFRSFKLPSLGAKNSFVYNDKLWLVSGSTNGGFFKLNNDYSTSEQFYHEGSRAKYVTQNGNYQAFFAIEPSGAYLRIANIDGTSPKEYRYSTLAQKVQNGKNVIAMDDKYVYLALSDKGVAKIAIANGELVDHFEPNTFRFNNKKVFSENGYTNGIAINDCYLYLANGADGVIVLNKNTFNIVGSFKLTESSNFVYASNGLLYVATGRSGLNIIKIN